MKSNKKPKFILNVKSINKEYRDNKIKKIEKIKDPNMSMGQKLLLVYSQDKTTTEKVNIKQIDNSIKENDIKKEIKENDSNINASKKKELEEKKEMPCKENIQPILLTKKNSKEINTIIDVNDIKKSDENKIQERIAEKGNGYSDMDKKIEILKSDKTTENSTANEIKENDKSFSMDNNVSLNQTNNTTFNASYNEQSTMDSTIIESQLNKSDINTSTSTDKILVIPNGFNEARVQYYIKYKLNDILLNESPNKAMPEKHQIKGEYWTFLYPNDLNTYCITQSGFLAHDKKGTIILGEEQNINEKNGLSFCGKNLEIKTEKGLETKKCSANEFICKECMQKNKEMYDIKRNYLINLNGRVAKINKGKYHCFGHFYEGKTIQDCITKFSCNACKMLDTFSNYYN